MARPRKYTAEDEDRVFEFIRERQASGRPPVYREIAAELGYGHGGVQLIVGRLVKQGRVVKRDGSRGAMVDLPDESGLLGSELSESSSDTLEVERAIRRCAAIARELRAPRVAAAILEEFGLL